MKANFHICRTIYSVILILLAAMNVDANLNAVEGYWTGVISRAGREWKVNVEFVRDKDGESARVDFPEVGAYGRKFSVKHESPKIYLERPQPNAASIVFDGSVAGDRVSGRWGGVGVTDATFVLRRAKKPAAGYREEEVTFTNGDVTLSGTLLLPESKGPHPAIIFTHGGGAQERGPNREPAIMFARRGIAALIYDKRGTGNSTGEWPSAGLDTLAADALAGVRLLKTRREIDPRRIGIEGHSQGGWVAPLAATESGGDVAFVIVSAASGINAAEQSVFHRANVIREAGFPEAAAAKASELRQQLYETARTGASREQLKADVEKIHREPWFGLSELPHPIPVDEKLAPGVRQMLFFEPAPTWEKISVPVLAVWGDRDTVVPVEKSQTIIRQALTKAGRKDFTVKIFPGVDHGVLAARPKDGAWDFPRRAPGYQEFMVAWALEKFGSKSKA